MKDKTIVAIAMVGVLVCMVLCVALAIVFVMGIAVVPN